LVPPLTPGLVRRRFVIGEPVRATEVILADLFNHCTDTLNDILTDPLPFFPPTAFFDRGITKPIEERVTFFWPEAIKRLIDKRDVEFRVDGIKNQTLAALQCVEIGGAAAAGPYCPREIRTNAAAVRQRIIRGTISVGATGRGTVPIGAAGWS
jgi:hypothetical protein